MGDPSLIFEPPDDEPVVARSRSPGSLCCPSSARTCSPRPRSRWRVSPRSSSRAPTRSKRPVLGSPIIFRARCAMKPRRGCLIRGSKTVSSMYGPRAIRGGRRRPNRGTRRCRRRHGTVPARGGHAGERTQPREHRQCAARTGDPRRRGRGASVTYLLATSMWARRTELAMLRALGTSRWGVRSSLAAQATATAVLVLAVSLPVGVVIGQWAWLGYADDLLVVPEATIPWTGLSPSSSEHSSRSTPQRC